MRRPRVITFNMTSIDGRLTLAPGVNLMTGDERWVGVTEGMGDPYLWARETHNPDLLLEGSGCHDQVYGGRTLPELIVDRGTPALFDAAPLEPDEWPTRVELLDSEVLPGGRVRLRYSVA